MNCNKATKLDEVYLRNKSQIKYDLTEEEALELYYSEPRLATLMDMDIIRLVDKHLVVNLKEFVTPKRKRLSAHAKRNISACCVGIRYLYTEKSKDVVTVVSTLDMIIQAADFMESENLSKVKQTDEEIGKESSKVALEIDRINGIINQLPGAFAGTLKCHMERKGYTEELLSQESWVSLSTIKQYRQKEEKEKTLKTMTALCIGLHLHPWFTEDLLRKAGIVPKATKQDSAYRYLYTFHYKDTIEDCNVYLRSQGLAEFKLREKSA